jgi:hypothetical protein
MQKNKSKGNEKARKNIKPMYEYKSVYFVLGFGYCIMWLSYYIFTSVKA